MRFAQFYFLWKTWRFAFQRQQNKVPFICQLERNENNIKKKKAVENMLVENGNKKNLDSVENVKRIMVKGKIKQSISLIDVKRCQKREYPSLL